MSLSAGSFFSRYPKSFWQMCAGCTLFFASFNLSLPEVGRHISELGRGDLKGLVIPMFSFMALISRPFSGKLADVIGRRPVMLLGAVTCVITGLFYPIVNTVWMFLLLRFIHGMSTGFTPTGNTAAAADVVSPDKRGEAMGILGMMNNVGASLGFSMGSLLTLWFGLQGMYWISTALAIAASIMFYTLPETHHAPEKFQWKMLKLKAEDLYEHRVFIPGLAMLLVCIPLGALLTVIPDVTLSYGFQNKGIFMFIYILSSLFVRVFSGRVSDVHGRQVSLMAGAVCMSLSLILLAFGDGSKAVFFLSAVLFGFGQGFNAPALFAWATDLGHPQQKGRALSTLYIFLELGITTGGLIGGFWFANKMANAPGLFMFCAGIAVMALILAFSSYRRR